MKNARSVADRITSLARNLWWTWNPDAQRLFAALDPALWEAANHNPLATLGNLAPERRAALDTVPEVLRLLDDCERQLALYLRSRTWFERHAAPRQRRPRIAYFCAEFGLHECLPQYAGGLGILAGDHLKSASDLGVPLVGVGLLYQNGYYSQALRADGSTRVSYPSLDCARLPIHDTGQSVRVPIARRAVQARIWRIQVGRVPLFLLDTDVPANRPADRRITARLYGGDQHTRIQQEIVLGVGGVRALDAVGVRANVFHLNEGHAAFCTLERLRRLRSAGVAWDRALRRVAASTVFTTHTPVPAGHDRFPPRLMRKYLGSLSAALGVPEEQWLALGRVHAHDRREPFCMTVLALRTSATRNGVSKIHGAVSREMWQPVFAAKRPAAVPIGHVTNGVHAETWLAPEMRALCKRYLKPRWVGAAPSDDWWRRASRIPPAELWATRCLLRRQLVHFVRARLAQQAQRRCDSAEHLRAAWQTFDENALTIGFARRFATYKRALLIFHDPRRLAALLNDPRRPVQIVFAGKAHPADAEGQRVAQLVHRYARRPEFRGRVALLEDYDMHVGRILTAGCDLWLNNPLPPQEASGTSGMKPPLNGGLNCSVLDGWWPEAYNGRNGWSIGRPRSGRTRAAQDRHDADSLYRVLESEIVPLFYERDHATLPRRWLRRIVASMQTICGRFSAHRMLAEYVDLYAASR